MTAGTDSAASAGAAAAKVDERVIAAGTTPRFAMLVVLFVAASASTLMPVLDELHGGDYLGCNLAAGVDPYHSANSASITRALGQAVPYNACLATYVPPPPWWQIAAIPLAVCVAAGLFLMVLPLWRRRSSRNVRLAQLDNDGTVDARLRDLARIAGIAPVKRIIVEPLAGTTGASVFGTNRRPTLRMNGGLYAHRNEDAKTFDAVVLHEFAHIANRDITPAYATIAMWRAFVLVVLVPYFARQGYSMVHYSGTWFTASGMPGNVRTLLLPVATAGMVYFARSDVLRARELYADLTADRWHADLKHVSVVTHTAPAGTMARRVLARVTAGLSTHPGWTVRRSAADDPARLFAVDRALMLLVGATAVLINYHVLGSLTTTTMLRNLSGWLVQAMAAIPAALVSGVAGIMLWRAVTHAAIRGERGPSGIRAGVWLGAGMALGALLSGQGAGARWLPQQPVLLLIAGLCAVAFTWWVTQCARLWVVSWRGRTLRLPLAISLFAAWFVLASWFAWWQWWGASFANGFWFSAAGTRQLILTAYPGTGTVHPAPITLMATVMPVIGTFITTALLPVAAVALWVPALAAWVVGAVGSRPRWLIEAAARVGRTPMEHPGTDLPPDLRQALLPGVIGGVAAWAAVAAIQGYLHAAHAGPQQRGGLFALSYCMWSMAAVVAMAALAATIAAAKAGRFHLVAALIAANCAAALGLCGMTVLMSTDGCVAPLSTLNSSCAWRPAWQQLRGGMFALVGNGVLVLTPLAAILLAAIVALVRSIPPGRGRGRGQRQPGRLDPGWIAPKAGGAIPAQALGAIVLCVAALATATTQTTVQAKQQSSRIQSAGTQLSFQRFTDSSWLPPVSAVVRASQVHAWYRLGGRYLLDHANADANDLTSVLRPAFNGRTLNVTVSLMSRTSWVCADFGRVASWENGYYFQVPDPQAQSDWHAFGVAARTGSTACATAAQRADATTFERAMLDLLTAGRDAAAASTRVRALIDDPQDGVYKGEPAVPARCC